MTKVDLYMNPLKGWRVFRRVAYRQRRASSQNKLSSHRRGHPGQNPRPRQNKEAWLQEPQAFHSR